MTIFGQLKQNAAFNIHVPGQINHRIMHGLHTLGTHCTYFIRIYYIWDKYQEHTYHQAHFQSDYSKSVLCENFSWTKTIRKAIAAYPEAKWRNVTVCVRVYLAMSLFSTVQFQSQSAAYNCSKIPWQITLGCWCQKKECNECVENELHRISPLHICNTIFHLWKKKKIFNEIFTGHKC